MHARKRIGLVAHDSRKRGLADWVVIHRERLAAHELYGTGTTAALLSERARLPVSGLKSGPFGGDQQLGAMIAEGRLDALFFFSDPMTAMPHDVDVKALVRLSTLYNILLACNRTTADFLIASPLFDAPYQPEETDYSAYFNRVVTGISE